MIGSATLQAMARMGLNLQQAAELVAAMEADSKPRDRTAAERQRRHRENKKADEGGVTRDMSQRDVTRDPPNDIYSNPPSPSANADGAEPEISPETVMWGVGKAFLMRHGVPKTKVGGLLGKWKREHGTVETMEALSAAERESRMTGGLVDPVGFIEGTFRHRVNSGGLSVPC